MRQGTRYEFFVVIVNNDSSGINSNCIVNLQQSGEAGCELGRSSTDKDLNNTKKGIIEKLSYFLLKSAIATQNENNFPRELSEVTFVTTKVSCYTQMD